MGASEALAKSSTGPARMPDAELCARLASELESLRAIGLRIELSLCSAADAWDVTDGRLHDLQQLDYLLQHLGALRDFLSALSDAAGGEASAAQAHALGRIRLADLKARLEGAVDQPRSAHSPEFF
ncbi:MAG TPA: hypothetical protein VG943_08455 [Caulobacterales bacterium]|nr:hypothetical protein [Caulobacterales bacterium]